MKLDFNSLFEAAAHEMLAAFKRGKAGLRPDEKGAPREEVVRTFLKQWVPNKYEISKGYVVNQNKDISKECDIIIFDSDKCPKFYIDIDKDLRIVPINHVYCVIEVKSILNSRELENAISKIQSVNNVHSNYIRSGYRGDNWEDINLFLARNNDLDSRSNIGHIKHIPKEEFLGYRGKLHKKNKTPNRPIRIIFAFELNEKLDMDQMSKTILSHDNPADLVFILNKGILTLLSELTAKRLMSMDHNAPVQKFDDSLEATLLRIGNNNLEPSYINVESSSEHRNLMYFYSFLMDMLNNQNLENYSLPADIVAIWQNDNEEK